MQRGPWPSSLRQNTGWNCKSPCPQSPVELGSSFLCLGPDFRRPTQGPPPSRAEARGSCGWRRPPQGGYDRVPLGPQPTPPPLAWGTPPTPGGNGGGGGAAGEAILCTLPLASSRRATSATCCSSAGAGQAGPSTPLPHPTSSTSPAWGLQGVSGYQLYSARPRTTLGARRPSPEPGFAGQSGFQRPFCTRCPPRLPSQRLANSRTPRPGSNAASWEACSDLQC